MEALIGLFDTVASFGAIVSRSDEKSQELNSLIIAMESISASVQAFAQDLLPEEREAAFHSNKVFEELLKQLRSCGEVINKRYDAIERAAAQARAVPAPSRVSTVACIDNALSVLRQGIRSCSREAIEALSGKLGGSLGSLLRLPEDELEVIRSSSTELQRMVPLVTLAITAHASRGRKRFIEHASGSSSSMLESEQKRPRPALQDDAGATAASTESRGRLPEKEDSKLLLQFISDSPVARGCELPTLTMSELRPGGTNGVSQASLETTSSGEGGSSDPGRATKKLLGRQEMQRVPKTFEVRKQHVSRFVSRDFLQLEELPQAESATSKCMQTLDMPTLEFGCDAGVLEDSGTLPMGGFLAEAAPLALATARSLCKTGFHCRSSGATMWRWIAQDAEAELRAGDCIAVLLESPPGSFNPGPARDLEAHEVTCLLGVEFRPSPHTV